MAKYTEAKLMSLGKRKLVKLLKKEGIDASTAQKKSELVRLLILAHKANTPSKTNRVTRNKTSRRFKIAIFISLLILISAALSYKYSPVFRDNIHYLIGVSTGEVEPQEDDSQFEDGPIVYEKAGKTYVVYNHPRPKVDVVTDQNCARPECDLQSYYDQIKESITPLAEFHEYDYQSRQGKAIIENFDVNLLPILVFDKTIEKTENFEQSSRFFKQNNDKYILQLDPFKALKGPDLSNGQVLGNPVENTKTPLTVVEYTSFSCPHCVDAYKNVEEILKIYEGNITVVIKYFSKGGNDMQAAIAAECASQQGKFLEMQSMLFDKQANWLPLAENGLEREFASYARSLDLDKQEFASCYSGNQEVIDLINAQTKEAESLAVDGLPTFFINNNIIQGSYPIESFTKIIDDILQEDGHIVETKREEEPVEDSTEGNETESSGEELNETSTNEAETAEELSETEGPETEE